MAEELGELRVKLSLMANDFVNQMNKVKGQAQTFGSNVSGALDKINKSPLGQITQSLTGLNLGTIGVASAVGFLVKEIDSSIDSFVKYAGEVDSLTNITGDSAENTSRLIQLTKLYGLSVDDLAMGQKKLAEQGMSLSSDTLVQLATQYQKLNTGQDRQVFLTEKLGKSGQKYAEILNQSTEALKRQYDAVQKGLVLTEEQIAQAEQLEIAEIQVQRNKETATNWVATQFIPLKLTVLRLMNIEAAAARIAKENDLNIYTQHKKIYELAYQEVALQERQAVVTSTLTQEQEKANAQLEESNRLMELSVAANTKLNQSRLSLAGQLSNAEETYQNALKDSANMTPAELKKIEDAHTKATRVIILGYMEQKFAADGVLTNEEIDWLLKKGVEWGIYSSTAIYEMRKVIAEAESVNNALNNIKDKTVSINVNTVYSSTGVLKPNTQSVKPQAKALGGSIVAGQSYIVGEGGKNELFTSGVNGNITPIDGKDMRELINAVKSQKTEIDYQKLAIVMRDTVLKEL